MPTWILIIIFGGTAVGNGAVGVFTRDGDQAQIERLIDAAVAKAEAQDAIEQAEVIRKLDSLERKVDALTVRVDNIYTRKE